MKVVSAFGEFELLPVCMSDSLFAGALRTLGRFGLCGAAIPSCQNSRMFARSILPLALILIACSGADDARDRQLDELTLGRINDVLNITQCAFNGTGRRLRQ